MEKVYDNDDMSSATIKESASMMYKGTMIEAIRHRTKGWPCPDGWDNRNWQCAGYVKVDVRKLPEDWTRIEQGAEKYPDEDWAQTHIFLPHDSPWNDLPFHGGVTYEDIESYGCGAFSQMKIGCDYNHSFDTIDMELSWIIRNMMGVVDAMCERLGVETLEK